MVQMKVLEDWRMPQIWDALYIPHGSDESVQPCLSAVALVLLYIPHGSDERYSISTDDRGRTPLYPTWFR